MSLMYLYWLLLLGLLPLSYAALTSFDYSLGPRRSILRVVNDDGKNGDLRDYGVELNATNFDAVLRDTPATFAVVEFFAHWLVIFF